MGLHNLPVYAEIPKLQSLICIWSIKSITALENSWRFLTLMGLYEPTVQNAQNADSYYLLLYITCTIDFQCLR